MDKIQPFLWFDDQAEAAAKFYVSVFKEAAITRVVRSGQAGPGPEGSVMTVAFTLAGRDYTALNGGPIYKFNEAVSLWIACEDQAEVDYYWERLLEGGEPSRCGWLKDRFGLSWQVVPTRLIELLGDPDSERTRRVMAAMMEMTKLDIATLDAAALKG